MNRVGGGWERVLGGIRNWQLLLLINILNSVIFSEKWVNDQSPHSECNRSKMMFSQSEYLILIAISGGLECLYFDTCIYILVDKLHI